MVSGATQSFANDGERKERGRQGERKGQKVAEKDGESTYEWLVGDSAETERSVPLGGLHV